jgi:thioesterase domain-containing protein
MLGEKLSKALKASETGYVLPEQNYSPIVLIQNGQHAVTPLFCVPGAGASITAFNKLSQSLNPNIPIYGLQPRGLDGILVQHTNVSSTALAYIKAIRKISPHGPYRLLGHSFGGWVVFEIALQLKRMGEQVDTLITLDTEAPSIMGDQRKRSSRIEALLELITLFELSSGRSLALNKADLSELDKVEQIDLLLSRLIETNIMPVRTKLPALDGIVRVFETNLNTMYAPDQIYPGPVHIARAANPSAKNNNNVGDYLSLWQQHAPQATLTEIPGNHMTMLSAPHVLKLADWLNALLI